MPRSKAVRAAPASAGSGPQKNDRLTINSTDKREVGGGQLIPLARIKHGGAQMRVGMSDQTVSEYADEMFKGAVFPPVIVYFDGTDYWLGDGFHRVQAALAIKKEYIRAEVRQGTMRDAILCGIGANALHGLRRTQADKRRAVQVLLADSEWSRLSDRKLAEIANVDHKTIGKFRRELVDPRPAVARRVGKFPNPPAKPNGKANRGLLAELLRTISDDMLIAECQRRGLMGASDV